MVVLRPLLSCFLGSKMYAALWNLDEFGDEPRPAAPELNVSVQ
jgi:hypothetical protein